MARGVSSAMAAGRFPSSGATSVIAVGAMAIIGFAAGGSGSVSPGSRYLENSSRVAKNFGVAQPASLMGAS